MKTIKKFILLLLGIFTINANGQNVTVTSPDNNISVTITNSEKLMYSVTFRGRNIIMPSQLGFELKDEPPMTGDFAILDQSIKNFKETWNPVVKSKHAEIINNYNELQLNYNELSFNYY